MTLRGVNSAIKNALGSEKIRGDPLIKSSRFIKIPEEIVVSPRLAGGKFAAISIKVFPGENFHEDGKRRGRSPITPTQFHTALNSHPSVLRILLGQRGNKIPSNPIFRLHTSILYIPSYHIK